MQDRVPLYPGRVKMTPVAGQANTFDMVRADDPTQAGTPLNKATFLKDATAALFGLGTGAVPDDVLAELGKYKQYWWRSRTRSVVEVKEDITSTVSLTYDSTDYAKFYYSKTVSVDSTGKVSLNSPITLYGVASSSSDASTLENELKPYLDNTPYYVSSKNVDGEVYYIPAGSSVNYRVSNLDSITFGLYREGSKTYYMVLNNPSGKIAAQKVTGAIRAGNWEFIQSSNRNAYPDSGISGGYEYEYLGIPLDNAVASPKIENGSYVGTGTHGQANPNTLTFGFVPKLVFIFGFYPSNSPRISGDNGTFDVTSLDGEYKKYGYLINGLSNATDSSNARISEHTLSWYSTYDQNSQLNNNGARYSYIAIG